MKMWPSAPPVGVGGFHSRRAARAYGRTLSGFALIELLATLTIILILMVLYWGPSSGSRQRALKRACQSNLERLYVSTQIFANDHQGQFPQVAGAHTSAEALGDLVPRYTSDTSVFICPGSRDSALPAGGSITHRKISYAYYMGRYLTNAAAVLLTDAQADTSAKTPGELAFSSNGKPPGNNHHGLGGNFLFCDGHVQSSPAHTPIALPLGPGEVLLNP